MLDIVLGIDIGGTNTKFGFVTESGELISHSHFSTNSDQHFEKYIDELWQNVQSEFKKIDKEYKLVGVGVGAPNANFKTGRIEHPTNLKWDMGNIVTLLGQKSQLSVVLDNDANIAAIGEKEFGIGSALSDFVVVTLGTGVGTGSFIDNELFHGAHFLGSEAGHICIDHSAGARVCGCGGIGHLEAYGSSSGIKLTAKEILGKDYRFREIKRLFLAGDKEMIPVVERTAMYLAQGLSMMGTLLCPQVFIITGGVSTLGKDFSQMIQVEYDKLIYGPFKGHTKILISQTSSEQGAILGAASLALTDLRVD